MTLYINNKSSAVYYVGVSGILVEEKQYFIREGEKDIARFTDMLELVTYFSDNKAKYINASIQSYNLLDEDYNQLERLILEWDKDNG